MRAIIDGVEIYGTPMEIMQYKEMVDVKRNNVKQYVIHFPAGQMDASAYGKQLNDELTKLLGQKYYL